MALVEQSALNNIINYSTFMMKNSGLFPVMKSNSIISLPALRKSYKLMDVTKTGAREFTRRLSCGICTQSFVTGVSSVWNLIRVYIERLVVSRLSWVP